MRLSNCKNFVPDSADNIHFVDSVVVRESVPRTAITGDGKKVTLKGVQDVLVDKPIPVEELEHRGVSCEMFTIENLERAGIEMKQITTPLFTPQLDSLDSFADSIEKNVDVSDLTEKDFETSNNV